MLSYKFISIHLKYIFRRLERVNFRPFSEMVVILKTLTTLPTAFIVLLSIMFRERNEVDLRNK